MHGDPVPPTALLLHWAGGLAKTPEWSLAINGVISLSDEGSCQRGTGVPCTAAAGEAAVRTWSMDVGNRGG